MKKVIGLCLVLLISSVSVFAQDGKRGAKKGGDPAQRCEKMIADLKLDEKQAADFRKVEAEFREKMEAERKQADLDRQKRRKDRCQPYPLRISKGRRYCQDYSGFTQSSRRICGRP